MQILLSLYLVSLTVIVDAARAKYVAFLVLAIYTQISLFSQEIIIPPQLQLMFRICSYFNLLSFRGHDSENLFSRPQRMTASFGGLLG
jgi:hypothetical protein